MDPNTHLIVAWDEFLQLKHQTSLLHGYLPFPLVSQFFWRYLEMESNLGQPRDNTGLPSSCILGV